MALNAIDVIEACYRFDLDEDTWLDGIAATTAEAIGSPLGAFISVRDGNETPRMRFSRNFRPDWLFAFVRQFADNLPSKTRRDPVAMTADALAPFLAGRCTAVSAMPSLSTTMLPLTSLFGGARDILTLNGFDPTGHGLGMGIPLARRVGAARATERVLSRITTHLAAAHRLRLRLRPDTPPDAVLDTSGVLLDSADDEAARARAELRQGTLKLEQARSRSVRRDEEGATALWTGLVSARWTLLDDFTAGGKRYVVARRNDLQVKKSIRGLTAREQQVLAHAADGRSNKEIAYELGIADSTVRVLLLRAAVKMGVRGRVNTVERFRKLDRRR